MSEENLQNPETSPSTNDDKKLSPIDLSMTENPKNGKSIDDSDNLKKDSSEVKNNSNFSHLIEIALKDLKDRRKSLEEEVTQLTKRKEQLNKDLSTTFSGQSDAIARRVKGFQDYLTGAFQDLVQSAEKLELIAEPVLVKPSPLDQKESKSLNETLEQVPAISDTFKPDQDLIRECLESFLGQPDFYADPWKLRRSLDQKDIDLLEDWFFNMGGRGAQPSRGTRSRNVLVSAGLISILGELYGDRFQTLVLASQPERLGEWRRGLQDALGLTREDFGPNSGIVLFERSDGVIERADRLEERGEVPLILIDALEQSIDIPVLQFPIWLAFAGSSDEIWAEEEEML